METRRPGTKVAEGMFSRPEGATMDDIRKATGGPQYNVLTSLESRGYRIRKVKEGRRTRYFAISPQLRSFEAKLTSQGQVTVPKEIRERLRLRPGGKVEFAVEKSGRVVLGAKQSSILDLVGILPKPKRTVTLRQMDEAIKQGAVDRHLRAIGQKK
jgi:AbrB family looped-hinge helix DNA binding protein